MYEDEEYEAYLFIVFSAKLLRINCSQHAQLCAVVEDSSKELICSNSDGGGGGGGGSGGDSGAGGDGVGGGGGGGSGGRRRQISGTIPSRLLPRVDLISNPQPSKFVNGRWSAMVKSDSGCLRGPTIGCLQFWSTRTECQ